MRIAIAVLGLSAALFAQELPIVTGVEHQPLAAQVLRVIEALQFLGEPLPGADAAELRRLAEGSGSAAVAGMQKILDRHCLVGVQINPESRVKVLEGPAKAELVEQGWRTFLVKVQNEAGITPVLAVESPNAGMLHGADPGAVARRFLDVQMFDKQPMRPRLSGLEVEYRILQIFSKTAGKREARLGFNVGQGTQDLGFRNEAVLLFNTRPAAKVSFRVLDFDDRPTTGAFLIKDAKGRVYPSQAKRLAPDFAFHPQIYRANGENVLLPPGEYTIEYTRGPEYRKKVQRVSVKEQPMDLTFRLERWIDPAKQGWYSGDHHIHAAGCAHYEKPTEGVYPKDMMRHILGEDLKVGSVLSWGPSWYFQKTFFEGKDHALSTKENLMRYDVEVSGFPSSHTGHICLLGLKEQDYPGSKRIEDWPSWGIPVFRWGKAQDAVTGFAHSGWGLMVKTDQLPTDELPPFDGIGANEFIVGVTHDLVDFISTVDTPSVWELNIWYHTLNVGYRTRISGETDFPCIYGERVGLGRSYVRQKDSHDYRDWVLGIREGRNYVSDGKSHLLDFRVNGVEMGSGSSEVKLDGPGRVRVTARVAALLDEQPDESIRRLRYDQKPYWDLERARVGVSRKAPVELIVNGRAVARREIEADGVERPVEFDYQVERSSWIALRILPSSHTNPIFALVGGQPVRASRKSAEWCLKAVDLCWNQKSPRIRLEERGEAERAYEFARQAYRSRVRESAVD
ncbi:MAG: CehA/McbA family metallohydrolase [Candidatus Solibacter usitatus]|nr:CehA/McbA family metallohydrolase [Candidatus Solibacter usitatus]